jgi:phenylpyruvate tautomerase PptA (4-oxalocrotonate tautomerase family)
MPLVRITYPRGALTPEQKRQIASSLTEIVLDAEVDAVTEAGRMVTVVHFNEAAADDWAVGGQLRSTAEGAPNHFIVDLIVLEGLLDGARRGDAHRRVTEAFQKVFGDSGDPLPAMRVWVLVHEVREGSWGAGGQSMSALDVAQFINSDLDPTRRAEIAASLARSARETDP